MPAENERKRQFNSNTHATEVVEGINLTGRTIAITGTTSGMGVETAKALISKGAHIVMFNRNVTESEKQKRSFIEEKPNAKIDIIPCDLNSLASVKKAGQTYLEKGWPLHGLILNAGVMGTANKTTSDGLEAHFGINHVAHFLLLQTLLPVLRSSAPSRLVIVSSDMNKANCIKSSASIDKKLDTLINKDTSKTWPWLYGCSKMCNIHTAFKVHRDEFANGISTYTLHPGVVKTELQRDSVLLKVMTSLSSPFSKDASQGAATSVYCVARPEVKDISGKYWDSCWDDEKGLDKKIARDEELQEALWKKTEEIIRDWERKQS